MKHPMLFEIIQSDCLAALREMPDASVDSIVTDPPYGLSKDPDIVEVLTKWIAGAKYEHTSAGFMGKTWDSFVPGPEYWSECFRVLKPGGHLLAFAGSRTYDLMCIAVRMGGFEIRDQLLWLYGSGFPKSHNVSKAIDKAAGHIRGQRGALISHNGSMGGPNYERTPLGPPVSEDAKRWDGWGTALKPAHEPIVMARKPFKGTVAANVLKHGTGAINVDGCRVAGPKPDTTRGAGGQNGRYGPIGAQGRIVDDGQGRWPANLIHDGSEEVLALFPETGKAVVGIRNQKARPKQTAKGAENERVGTPFGINDNGGSAARYFYCAKASKRDRDEGLEFLREKSAAERTERKDGSAGINAYAGATGSARNHHPTVKPTALMRHLVRLVTPPNGTVLDPFCGSGSTGKAALLEGFRFVGIEREEEYVEIAKARCEWAEEKAGAPPENPREMEAQSEPAELDRSQRNLFDESS